jgi:hypothetical protein
MNSILNFRAAHQGHLSEQQIEDQLIGDLAPEPAAHLERCKPCRLRVAEAAAPMVHFRAVAMEWSERRSSTLPLQAGTVYQPQWAQRLAMGTATAALLAMAFAVPMRHTPGHPQGAGAVSATPTQTLARVAATPQAPSVSKHVVGDVRPSSRPVEDDTAITRDNQILQEIDVALSTPAASPASLGLETVGSEENSPQLAPTLLQD